MHRGSGLLSMRVLMFLPLDPFLRLQLPFSIVYVCLQVWGVRREACWLFCLLIGCLYGRVVGFWRRFEWSVATTDFGRNSFFLSLFLFFRISSSGLWLTDSIDSTHSIRLTHSLDGLKIEITRQHDLVWLRKTNAFVLCESPHIQIYLSLQISYKSKERARVKREL